MNEIQKEKQAHQHRVQAMQALKSGQQQFVTVTKGKTDPDRLHFPNLERDCRMKSITTNVRCCQDTVELEHWRDGKLLRHTRANVPRTPPGRPIPYDITNEGLNNILSVGWNAGTQVTAWYIGMIDDLNYVAVADDDTYDDIDQAGNDWDEFQSYTDANNADNATTRPLWTEDAPSSQSITNGTTKSIYDITASGTVKGVFVCGGIAGAQTKGDHAPGGFLWATALFSGGDVVVANGDQLKITYTINASHA